MAVFLLINHVQKYFRVGDQHVLLSSLVAINEQDLIKINCYSRLLCILCMYVILCIL